MKVAIINFPGTNCERDTKYAFDLLGANSQIIWHKETSINADLVVLPGGFSHGDYLRTAAIAKFSPIMNAVVEHAKKGGYILGICNGFQMLLELKLLSGAMNRNINLSFISKYHHLKVISNDNKFLSNCKKDEISEKNLFYLLLSKEQFVRGIIFWWGIVPVAIYITNIGYSFSSRIIIYIVLLAIRSILTRAIARKFKKIVIDEKTE